MKPTHTKIAKMLLEIVESGNIDEAIALLKVATPNSFYLFIEKQHSLTIVGPYKDHILAAIHAVARNPAPRTDLDVAWLGMVQEYDSAGIKAILEDPESYGEGNIETAQLVKPSKRVIKIHPSWKSKLTALDLEGLNPSKWDDVILYPARSVFLAWAHRYDTLNNIDIFKLDLDSAYLRNQYTALK